MRDDITIVRNVGIGWNPCSEECYPTESDDIVIIALHNGETWQYWLYDDCPYGWNVLCRNKAYWKTISKPFI